MRNWRHNSVTLGPCTGKDKTDHIISISLWTSMSLYLINPTFMINKYVLLFPSPRRRRLVKQLASCESRNICPKIMSHNYDQESKDVMWRFSFFSVEIADRFRRVRSNFIRRNILPPHQTHRPLYLGRTLSFYYTVARSRNKNTCQKAVKLLDSRRGGLGDACGHGCLSVV
jgi:hypothetical protein